MNEKDETQQREPRKGVFDQKGNTQTQTGSENNTPEEQHITQTPKQDMEDVFSQQGREVKNRAKKASNIPETESDRLAAQINKSLSDDPELADIEINEDDVKLAEKLIFDGYAETDVVMDSFPNSKFTMCSTNAEEMGMIDEVIFDVMKKAETDDGMVDIPQNKIQTLRNAIFVALGYRGRDSIDLCGDDKSRNLHVIKKGIVRRGDLEIAGKVKETGEINDSLKQAILIRARRVQQLPTPLIDFLSAEKWKFDKKMYKIMTQKGVIPKS